MVCTGKVFFILLAAVWSSATTEGDTVKRDLIGQHPTLDFLHLGNFGPLSRLPSHPAFAQLGLTPQQSIGFVNVLLQNGFLSPHALRLANGQPFVGNFYGSQAFHGHSYGGPAIDPYFLYLWFNHGRFLPFGLGPQGIYGSTGLPRPRPLGVFKHIHGINDEAFGKLCFVGLVYRHGDRAPVAPYPKDPYSDVSCWPNGWAQLTKLGKLQQYELGKWIRHIYWDFLPLRYNPADIYVRSTDVDRTLMSAYCNLAGLYECWNEEDSDGISWQPIPVHTTPVEMDEVLAAHKKCPVYEKLVQDAMKKEDIRLANEMYQEVFSNLSALTGLTLCSVRDCVYLYSTLNIQNLHGFRLPDWTKDYFPQPLKEISEFAFKLPCFTTPMKRLKCGPLLKDIIKRMEDKKDGRISQRMWMYSAHDTTLANLMQCLGVFDGDIPPYTATLIFELFHHEDDFYISISYKTPTTFRVLRLPCCEKFCSFEKFKKILKPVIPLDWERECGNV